MITDMIVEAMDSLIDICGSEEQKLGMKSLREMLCDLDEDQWPDMDECQRNDWLAQYLSCQPALHYYEAWVRPRHGYEYPVYFAHTQTLTKDQIHECAKRCCYFLAAEDAEDLCSGREITRDAYEKRMTPDEYVESEYGSEEDEG